MTAQLRLPEELRGELKEPLGPVVTDVDAIPRAEPVVAVGDVVTDHLRSAGRPPAVAVVDGMTERSPVDDALTERVEQDVEHQVQNPAAVVTADLVTALEEALAESGPTTILVDGEEDLATLPALVLAPEGATVVYGQPGEGMVVVRVEPAVRDTARSLLERFEGDHEHFEALLS